MDPTEKEDDSLASDLLPSFNADSKAQIRAEADKMRASLGVPTSNADPKGDALRSVLDAEGDVPPDSEVQEFRLNEADDEADEEGDGSWALDAIQQQPGQWPTSGADPATGFAPAERESSVKQFGAYAKDVMGQATAGVGVDFINAGYDTFAAIGNLLSGKSLHDSVKESYGDTSNNPVSYPRSETFAGELARVIPEWMIVEVALRKGTPIGRWSDAIGLGAGLELGPSAPRLMKLWQSKVFHGAISGAIADAVVNSQMDNLHTLLAEQTGASTPEGSGSSAWDAYVNFMATQPGTDAGTAAANAWRAALEGIEMKAVFNSLGIAGKMGRAAYAKVMGTDAVKGMREALYSMTDAARNYRALRAGNPQVAAAGQDAANAMAAAARNPAPRGTVDPLDQMTGPSMDNGEPGAAPNPFHDDDLWPNGSLVAPRSDRKLLEGMRDANITAEGDVLAEQAINDVRGTIEAAYQAGQIKSSSVMFRAYSRDLWRQWDAVNALQDKPLTRKQMQQLKRVWDNRALHWSHAVDQPAELYYRMKFGPEPSKNWRSVNSVADELGPDALKQVYTSDVSVYHGTAPGSQLHKDPPDARKTSWTGKLAHGLYTAGEGYAFTYSSGEVFRVRIPKGTRFLNMESTLSSNREDYEAGVKLALWTAEDIAKTFPTTVGGESTKADELVQMLKEIAYGNTGDGTPGKKLLDGVKLWNLYEPLFDWAHLSHMPPSNVGESGMLLNAKTGKPSDPQEFFEQYIQKPIRDYGYDVIEEAEPASARHADGSMVRIIIDPTDNIGIGRTARLKIDPVAPPGGQRVVSVATNLHNAAKKEGPLKFYSFIEDTIKSVSKDVLGDPEKLRLVDPSDLDTALPPLSGTPAHGMAPVNEGRPVADWTSMPERNMHVQMDGLVRAATAGDPADAGFATFHFTYASDLKPEQVGEAADEVAMRLRDKWVKKAPKSQPPAVGYLVTGDFPGAVINYGHGQINDGTWVMSSEYRTYVKELANEDLVFVCEQLPEQAALPLTQQGTYKALVEAGVPSHYIASHPTDGIYVISPAVDPALRSKITEVMETSPHRAGDPAASVVKQTGGRYDITNNLADTDWRARGFQSDTRGPHERKAERAYYAQQTAAESGDVPDAEAGWDWGDFGSGSGGDTPLYQRDAGGDALGGYTVDPQTGHSIVGLTKGANYSTWLHESAHAFFEDLSILPGVPYDELYAFAGVAKGTAYADWPTEAKEKWARAFEKYAYEGVSPNPELTRVFAQQRKWMQQVYGPTIAAEIDVPMSDKVKDFIGHVMAGPRPLPHSFSFTRRTSDDGVWVNHDRIDSEEDIDGLMQAVADADKPLVDYASGETLTLNDVIAKANRQGITVPELLGMSAYTTPEKAFAARQMEVASAETVVRLADVARNSTDPNDLYRFRRALTVHRAINAKNRALSRAASRALGSRRAIAHSTKARLRAIEELVQNEGADNMRSLADEVSALARFNPAGLDNFVAQLDKASKWDAFHEVFVNNLLWSPKTHLVNMLGNSATIALTMAHAVAGATIDEALHDGKNFNMREVGEMTNGLLRGVTDGWKLARAAFKDGAVLDYGKGTVETAGPGAKHAPAFVPETFGRRSVEKLSDDPISWGLDAMGRFMRTPTRALKSSDAFFFTVNYRMELHRLAYRNAMAAFEASGGAMTQKELADRIVKNLTSPTEEMLDKAIKFGKKQTFTSELNGRALRLASTMAGTPVFRKVFPFMRTPINIFKYAFENTPLAPLSADFRARLTSKDAGEAAMAKAQLGISTLMFFAVGDMVDKGVITGGYSAKPGERRSQMRSGVGQYSIGASLDGPRVPFNRVEPIGSAVSMMADVWMAIDKASDPASNELAVAAILHLSDSLTSKTYLKNFSDIINALHEGDYARLTSVAAQTGMAHVPMSMYSLVSAMEGTVDPAMRDPATTGEEDYAAALAQSTSTGTAQVVYRLVNEAWAKIPGLSDELPHSFDLWGRKISYESPLHDSWYGKAYEFTFPVTLQRSPDPQVRELEQMLQRNRFFPEQPERQIDDVRLTAKEYEEYVAEAGKEALRELRANLPYLRSLPDDGPDGDKVAYIRSVISDARERAANKRRDAFPSVRTEQVSKRQALSSKRQWGMTAESLQGIKRKP